MVGKLYVFCIDFWGFLFNLSLHNIIPGSVVSDCICRNARITDHVFHRKEEIMVFLWISLRGEQYCNDSFMYGHNVPSNPYMKQRQNAALRCTHLCEL